MGNCSLDSVRVGSKVYYKDNGPTDTGVIIDIVLDNDAPFVVKWDKQLPNKEITTRIVQPELGIDFNWEYNPSDENIDTFDGSQLILLEY